MPDDADLDKTAEETRVTLEMFDRLQQQVSEIEAQKEQFHKKLGIDYDKLAEWSSAQSLSPADRKKWDEEKAAFEAELARELDEAEQKYRTEKNQATSRPVRPKRLRGDMV